MNLKTKKIELLAPAGDLETLMMAIDNGADAVYIGGKNFGARALAKNFDHDELKEAIRYAHLKDAKIYVTVNTMLYEGEIENALKEVGFLYEIGVDGLIVSDLGLIDSISKIYPDIELHISTQANIQNKEAFDVLKELGAKRVVLPRELSKDEIKNLTNKGLEVEIFAHGALCVSFSGQCLMGSVLNNRSGNRGLCSQCCRMKYKLYDEDNKEFIKTKGSYLLSTKDLNLLSHIEEIIEMGVDSIKIEGRMKRKEYVAFVTRVYRKAIDSYYENKEFYIDDNLINDLKLLFNREFTDAYYANGDIKGIMNPYKPNHIGIYIGKVISYQKNKIAIKLTSNLSQGDGLRIVDSKGEEYGLVANKIYKNRLLVNGANKDEIVEFAYDKRIENNAKVFKTSDINLLDEINKYKSYRSVAIDIYYEFKANHRAYLKLSDKDNRFTEVYGDILDEAINKPMTKTDIEKQLIKTNNTIYEVSNIDGISDNVFIAISALNKLRRDAIEKMNQIRLKIKDRRINDIKAYNLNKEDFKDLIIEINDEVQLKVLETFKDLNVAYISSNEDLIRKYPYIYYLNSNINIDEEYKDYNRQVMMELGALKYSDIAYMTLNIANSKSVAYLMDKGIKAIILSAEIDDILVDRLIDSFEKEYHFKPNLFVYRYGKRDLMYFRKNMLYKDLANINKEHNYSLVDYNNEHYSFIKKANRYILQESKTELLNRNHKANDFLKFTDESANEAKRIMMEYLSNLHNDI